MKELKYEQAVVLAMGMLEARKDGDRETENHYAARLAMYSGNMLVLEADARTVLSLTGEKA